jgi:hypothetical protein
LQHSKRQTSLYWTDSTERWIGGGVDSVPQLRALHDDFAHAVALATTAQVGAARAIPSVAKVCNFP